MGRKTALRPPEGLDEAPPPVFDPPPARPVLLVEAVEAELWHPEGLDEAPPPVEDPPPARPVLLAAAVEAELWPPEGLDEAPPPYSRNGMDQCRQRCPRFPGMVWNEVHGTEEFCRAHQCTSDT